MRPARFSDIPALLKLLRSSHERSKYAGRTDLHEKAMEQMLTGLVAGQTQQGVGATYLQVAETDGKVTGFVAGMLNRVYNIGTKLVANDLFLVNEAGSLKTTMALIDGYIAWARANPKVIEVGLSWSDALPGANIIADIYRRKGAHMVGEQYEIRLDVAKEEAA